MTSFTLNYEKETENKFRWITDVGDVAFTLYIPQAVLPDPHPQQLRVWVEVDARSAASVKANLKATVVYVSEHTETVRYAPIGDPATWTIGEPYIPQSLFQRPWPQRLYIAVSWD